MKYILISLLIISSFSISSAQSQKKVKEHKISTKVESEINFEDGLKVKRVLQEESFNKKGQLIEFKDWTKDGKIKEWMKYTYTEDGEIATEEQFNHKGALVEKVVFTYKDGLKIKKSYFDNKERLIKEKYYEYTHF